MFRTFYPSYSSALALSLFAATASAQTITVGPGTTAVTPVPTNGPLALGVLLAFLALAAWRQLRRGPAAQRVLGWFAVAIVGVAMHGAGLLALPLNSFTNSAGETLPIPIVTTSSGADFTGFVQQEFANNSGAALRVTGLVLPSQGQCFTGVHTADKLLQPGSPSGSVTPACQVGTALANGAACRVDVDAVCRALLGPAPTLASISPTTGAAAGGTSVILSGSGLSGATAVSFGGIPGTVVSSSATTVAVAAPAHAAGAVDVTLNTPAGMVRLPAAFAYIGSAPTAAFLVPTAGPLVGGTNVSILGTGFVVGDTSVMIDGTVIPAGSVTVYGDTLLSFVTPAHAAGTAAVTVTTSDGTTNAIPSGFTYVAVPTAASLAPAAGPSSGGTVVTLTGTNFLAGNTTVMVGGTVVSNGSVIVHSASSLTFTMPAHLPGNVTVSVSTVGGTSAVPGGFTYLSEPVISSISPSTGPTAGGTLVTITGANLTGTTGVAFDQHAATSVMVINDTTLTAVTPAGMVGSVDVAVTSPGGTATIAGGFIYQ